MVRSVNLWDGRRVSIFGNVKRLNNFPKNFGIIIFQEFSETNYFPKIFQEFSKKFRGLKKLVEIIFLFLLKIKREKLIHILIRITYTYIYTYNLYVYKPKKQLKVSACRSWQGAQSPQLRNVPRNVYGQPQRLVYIYINGGFSGTA